MNFKSEPGAAASLMDSRAHMLGFSSAPSSQPPPPPHAIGGFPSQAMFPGLVTHSALGGHSGGGGVGGPSGGGGGHQSAAAAVAAAAAAGFPGPTWEAAAGQALQGGGGLNVFGVGPGSGGPGADIKPNLAVAAAAAAAAAQQQMPRLPAPLGSIGPQTLLGLPSLGQQNQHHPHQQQQQQQPQSHAPQQHHMGGDGSVGESTRTIMERIAAYDAKASKKLDSISDFVEKQLIPSLGDPDSLFHNLCFFLEQALFTLVDWARNADYFKAVSVEDQMQLLNSSWGEILLLEYLYHCVNDNRMDSIVSSWYSSQLQHSADILDLLDLSEVKVRLMDLIERIQNLQLDKCEFAALKFLLMFNAGKHDIVLKQNVEFVNAVEFKISCSLLDYILEKSPQQADKFGRILLRLPEIKYLAFKLECYLTDKLRTGKIPRNTLIAEMLLSKTKSFGGDQTATALPSDGPAS